MKRNALLLACLLLLCTGCSARNEESSETEPVTEAVVETTEATEPEPTDPPRDLKEYHFASAEEAAAISTADIKYILSNPYYSTDFVDLEPFDYFDQELVQTTDSYGYEVYELCAVEIPSTDTLLEELDVSKPFDSGQIETIARERSHALVGDAGPIAPAGAADEPGRSVSDAEYIFCGENDSYTEYSIRYNEVLRQEYNDEIITTKIPRIYRRMYLKNFVEASDGKRTRQVLLGKLSKAYVQQQLDLLADRIDSRVIYRDVTEAADDNGSYYYYNYLHIDYSQGNYGEDATAYLAKSCIRIDKETHLIERFVDEVLNEVELENTAVSWPKF